MVGLVERGLLVPDPFGGFVCDDSTLRVDPNVDMYVAGHLARGSQLMTSGLSHCRAHAQKIAASILRHTHTQ